MLVHGLKHALRLLLLLCALNVYAHAADAPPERNFYDVLEDVMGDFEFDLKNGNVGGLSDLGVRNVALSENVPDSFKSHLELLISERILKNSKTKVIQCLPCKAKKTSLNGDQVVITSSQTNPEELTRIAKMSGISHFMDAAFSYQPSGMVLSLTISDPQSGSVVWSRSYNSETSRAAAFRRGVDYSQIDDARKITEYTPTIQYRGMVSYMYEPNLTGSTGVLAFSFRMVERYDNRKKEVGFQVDYMREATSFAGSSSDSAASEDTLYGGLNLTLLFVHAWNFIGDEENFNRPRASFLLGIGGTYASGFLGGLVRAGWEWRLGKRFALNAAVGYRPSSTAFLGSFETVGTTVSGPEFGLGVSLCF